MKKAGKIIFIVILSIIRIITGSVVGVWFPAAQLWDDALMMGYSDIEGHFSNPARYSLLKDMSFPIFLKLSSETGLPYTITLSLLWIAAGIVVYRVFRKLFQSDIIPLFMFVYVLFMPQAFELWCGTRLYRNAIIGPWVIITFTLMVNLLVDIIEENRPRLTHTILLALAFSFTYYIKEDGIWLLACLIFAMVIGLAFLIYQGMSEGGVKYIKYGRITTLFVPLIFFILITAGYKEINKEFFGVYEINTRTSGEYGRFVENMYRIDSPNRSISVWTPYDAIEQAFGASETLSEHPELLTAIMTTDWQSGDIKANPIRGDHFNWILREEMYNVGLYKSESDVDLFFKQVNSEIEEAFADGRLKKQKGVVQIVSSAGGYTFKELKSLIPLINSGFKGSVWLDGYTLGLWIVDDFEINENRATIEYAKTVTHLDYLDDYTKARARSDGAVKYLTPVMKGYRYLNLVLFIITLLIIVYELINIIRNAKTVKTFLTNRCRIFLGVFGSVVFLGISLCYTAAIGWFSAFLFVAGHEINIDMTVLNFYNIALPGLLFMAYAFTVYTIWEEVRLIRNH